MLRGFGYGAARRETAPVRDHRQVGTTFTDDDADLSLVQDRNVAVLGYGDQARAHALCVRDSGVDVRIGVEAGSVLAEDAAADGLRVVTSYEACEEADLVAGVAMFAAVVHDASGRAWDMALAYARAVGATRAGVIRTGDAEYATARRAAEALVGTPVLALFRSGFDTLVASGCLPEVAYLLCVRSFAELSDELGRGELDAAVAAARSGAGDPSQPDRFPAAAGLVRSMIGWAGPGGARLH